MERSNNRTIRQRQHWIRKQESDAYVSFNGDLHLVRTNDEPVTVTISLTETVIDVVGKKRRDIIEVKSRPGLIILFAHNNLLENVSYLCHLKNLRKLDLAYNMLHTIPDKNMWASLTQLQILYLQHNNLQSLMNVVEPLTAAPSLLYL